MRSYGRAARRATSWVRKPLERYHARKILIQKSSAHLIAALDRVSKRHPGYVFPQSVYAVELTEHGMDHCYLLCLLNSRVLNEYIWRTVTGYKLLQPQLELEDIRALPIRRINFTTHISQRQAEVARGIAIFESESLQIGDFPRLANFAVRCLSASSRAIGRGARSALASGPRSDGSDSLEPKIAGRGQDPPG